MTARSAPGESFAPQTGSTLERRYGLVSGLHTTDWSEPDQLDAPAQALADPTTRCSHLDGDCCTTSPSAWVPSAALLGVEARNVLTFGARREEGGRVGPGTLDTGRRVDGSSVVAKRVDPPDPSLNFGPLSACTAAKSAQIRLGDLRLVNGNHGLVGSLELLNKKGRTHGQGWGTPPPSAMSPIRTFPRWRAVFGGRSDGAEPLPHLDLTSRLRTT